MPLSSSTRRRATHFKQNLVAFGIASLLWSLLATAAPQADFAIYNTNQPQAVDGVWKEEVAALEKLLPQWGYTFVEVGPADIQDGKLLNESGLRYRALIMPGGYSAPRYWALHTKGPQQIRAFLEKGGNYLGFCAGAYYAAQNIRWAEKSSDDQVNRRENYYHFPNVGALDLLPSKSSNATLEISNHDADEKFQGPQGPLGWSSYADLVHHPEKRIEPTQVATGLAKKLNIPDVVKLYYFSGPAFVGYEHEKNVEVWARAVAPLRVGKDYAFGADQPTIVRYRPKGSQAGSVVLSAYHPVMAHPSQTEKEYRDSLSLLNAMLQVAANQKIRPLDSAWGSATMKVPAQRAQVPSTARGFVASRRGRHQ
jgi:glutamine amidotransferase-like uncharacterized protein